MVAEQEIRASVEPRNEGPDGDPDSGGPAGPRGAAPLGVEGVRAQVEWPRSRAVSKRTYSAPKRHEADGGDERRREHAQAHAMAQSHSKAHAAMPWHFPENPMRFKSSHPHSEIRRGKSR